MAGNYQLICSISLLVILLIATWTDLQSRRIPNRLILIGLVFGLAMCSFEVVKGLTVGGSRLAACLLAAGAHWLPYYYGKMGAGDVKLAGVIGLLLGWRHWGNYLGCYGGVLGITSLIVLCLPKGCRVHSLPLAPLMCGAYLLYLLQLIRL